MTSEVERENSIFSCNVNDLKYSCYLYMRRRFVKSHQLEPTNSVSVRNYK